MFIAVLNYMQTLFTLKGKSVQKNIDVYDNENFGSRTTYSNFIFINRFFEFVYTIMDDVLYSIFLGIYKFFE